MSFLRNIYYWLSPSLRLQARRWYYWPGDFLKGITGKRPAMVPPKGLTFTGAGDFLKEGAKYGDYFKKYGLKPHDQVLDVGCGLGRMAVPLTSYLTQEGGYLGFDIMPAAINWCNRAISSRFPPFRFVHYQGGNDLYNTERSTLKPFPARNSTYDFAILTSVFSHLQPDETAFFLEELNRCLTPKGTVFATFFIYPDEAQAPFNPDFAFPFDYGHYCLMNNQVKGANVAYRSSWLLKLIVEKGFCIKHQLPGFWLTGKKEHEFQDILILQKVDNSDNS